MPELVVNSHRILPLTASNAWNVPIDGAAAEHQPARRREHRAPVGATGIAVRPHALAGIDVPGLHFADVIGAGVEERPVGFSTREHAILRCRSTGTPVSAPQMLLLAGT